MKIDANDLRRHYESLSDDEMRAINLAELTDVARKVYDEEWTRRGLDDQEDAEESDLPEPAARTAPRDIDDGDFDVDTGPPPEWAEDAACACSFSMHRGDVQSGDAKMARAVLRAAGIPCSVIMRPVEDEDGKESGHEYSVMVPGALTLHATSILDRDLFNEKLEDDWRAHFENLPDNELRALNPDIFCAGFLDRVARLRRAYTEEIARRGLK